MAILFGNIWLIGSQIIFGAEFFIVHQIICVDARPAMNVVRLISVCIIEICKTVESIRETKYRDKITF